MLCISGLGYRRIYQGFGAHDDPDLLGFTLDLVSEGRTSSSRGSVFRFHKLGSGVGGQGYLSFVPETGLSCLMCAIFVRPREGGTLASLLLPNDA